MSLLGRIAILFSCQGLLILNNITMTAVNGLAGRALATNKALATLPLSAYVVGSALSTLPASFFMQRFGRRAGFTLGAAFGVVGALVCTVAVRSSSFEALCIGAGVTGAYNAFAQQYRFAAAELAPDNLKARAISLVLAGGIAGGVLGPEMSKVTRSALPTEFLGTYASLAVVAVITMVLLQFLRFPEAAPVEQHAPARRTSEIVAQPTFLVAVLAGAVGYGVMNLLMSATPLAMGHHHHGYDDAAFVIEWHVIGMFAPSFLTGSIIRRIGAPNVMLAGVGLNLVCVAVAVSGTKVVHFWIALVALGIGWNAMYTGATTLLAETHAPAERARAQGINDLCLFATMAVTSFGSGALLHMVASGWLVLNYISLPFLLATGAAIAFWKRARRAA